MTVDNPAQTDRLLSKLRSSLPLAATITPEFAGTLRGQMGSNVPATCEVTAAGDEGGIVCGLVFGPETGDQAVFASITHLRFGGGSPLAREIAAYQKHRTKRLRRLGTTA